MIGDTVLYVREVFDGGYRAGCYPRYTYTYALPLTVAGVRLQQDPTGRFSNQGIYHSAGQAPVFTWHFFP